MTRFRLPLQGYRLANLSSIARLHNAERMSLSCACSTSSTQMLAVLTVSVLAAATKPDEPREHLNGPVKDCYCVVACF